MLTAEIVLLAESGVGERKSVRNLSSNKLTDHKHMVEREMVEPVYSSYNH